MRMTCVAGLLLTVWTSLGCALVSGLSEFELSGAGGAGVGAGGAGGDGGAGGQGGEITPWVVERVTLNHALSFQCIAGFSLSADESTLLYSIWLGAGAGYYDVYAATNPTAGSFGYNAVAPVTDVNTSVREWTPFLARDGSFVLFSRQEASTGGDIWIALRDSITGAWNPPEPVASAQVAEQYEQYPSVTADGSELYFANRPGSMPESAVIFRAVGQPGTWGPPEPLGADINGPDTDDTPAISPDGQRLFFASSRAGGAGGLDLWVSERRADGGFDASTPLPAPINTDADEYAPWVSDDGDRIYFLRPTAEPGGATMYPTIYVAHR